MMKNTERNPIGNHINALGMSNRNDMSCLDKIELCTAHCALAFVHDQNVSLEICSAYSLA